tara:strand:- start:256 stop:900 length:645 start_codon:yes stop_codon:yes gene_type:complete
MNKKYTQTDLENIFANNFASPIFPVLANIYYDNKEYNRASQVCEIGLKHDPKNLVGQFILAKLYLNDRKYKAAEKILKHIVSYDPCNMKALLLLIDVSIDLKRSKDTINRFIISAYNDLPKNIKIKKLLSAYSIPSKIQAKEKTKIKVKKHPVFDPVAINKEMATKTMYSMMLKQKKYKIAHEILLTMKANKKHQKYVNIELKKIKKNLDKGKK